MSRNVVTVKREGVTVIDPWEDYERRDLECSRCHAVWSLDYEALVPHTWWSRLLPWERRRPDRAVLHRNPDGRVKFLQVPCPECGAWTAQTCRSLVGIMFPPPVPWVSFEVATLLAPGVVLAAVVVGIVLGAW